MLPRLASPAPSSSCTVPRRCWAVLRHSSPCILWPRLSVSKACDGVPGPNLVTSPCVSLLHSSTPSSSLPGRSPVLTSWALAVRWVSGTPGPSPLL